MQLKWKSKSLKSLIRPELSSILQINFNSPQAFQVKTDGKAKGAKGSGIKSSPQEVFFLRITIEDTSQNEKHRVSYETYESILKYFNNICISKSMYRK